MNLGINKLLISHQTNRKQCHYFALQKSSLLFSNTNICYNIDPAENKVFFFSTVLTKPCYSQNFGYFNHWVISEPIG